MPRTVLSLNVSPVRDLVIDGQPVPTGILKRGVDGRRRVERLGIEGDAQSDLEAHGGAAKAVYAYPSEHYPFWETLRAQFGVAPWAEPMPHGMLGENLTLSGMLESDAWVGDVLRFPDCALAVSQPRYPCFKLNAAMGFRQAAKAMVAQAWCGFYLAVRVPGTIAAGEAFEIEPGPREIGIAELFRARTRR